MGNVRGLDVQTDGDRVCSQWQSNALFGKLMDLLELAAFVNFASDDFPGRGNELFPALPSGISLGPGLDGGNRRFTGRTSRECALRFLCRQPLG
jgi:hypothetical protein